MDKIILIKPYYKLKNRLEDYVAEVLADGSENRFAGASLIEMHDDILTWMDRVEAFSHEITCPDDKVPADVYVAVRESDEEIIGLINLRHHIDHPVLSTWGGHIGYNVRPSQRGKGYGREMLRLNLENARELGLDKVLLTCNEDNIASEKIILANGGEFSDTYDNEGKKIKRFWIHL